MTNLVGFIWEHENKEISTHLVELLEEDIKAIETILMKYEDKGVSIRGCTTLKDIQDRGL
jgi:hypothetical protein